MYKNTYNATQPIPTCRIQFMLSFTTLLALGTTPLAQNVHLS